MIGGNDMPIFVADWSLESEYVAEHSRYKVEIEKGKETNIELRKRKFALIPQDGMYSPIKFEFWMVRKELVVVSLNVAEEGLLHLKRAGIIREVLDMRYTRTTGSMLQFEDGRVMP
ncbi:hypothetical protein SUGI_0959170 [Cryptomeria japonica]|nr:hypothetical protein SUGI_0959170 [Cryptomeria japonica]